MFNNLRAKIALAVLPKGNGKGNNPFQVIATHPANIPIYTDMTVRRATREGYKVSVYVYRAVRTIVQAASAIPWLVEDKKGEPIEDHPLTKVLRNPNPVFSGQDLIEFLIAHLELAGNALWQPIIVGGKVKELWPVMPDLVQPIPSDVPGEWLKGWKVTSAYGVQHDVPPEQFIHFMQIDPGNPYWGMGPLLAAARTVDTDNEAQDTQKISMQNRATPDGVFTHESVLTQEQFEEARRQIRENFLAKTKKREPWVLGAGAKWNQMSMTPVEMDFIASRLANLRGIAAAFGLDPWWLGDRSASTYNNVLEARKALYVEVVIPMLDDIKATLNLRLAPLYGDIVISYDTSKVAALREDFTQKVEQARTLWAMGVPFDQINDRLEMGFEEFPGWEQGYLPLTLMPTGSSPTPAGEPEKRMGGLVNNPELGIVSRIESRPLIEKALNLQTEEQKAAHWKRIDRRRIGWWGVVSRKMLPLYEAEAKAIEKALKGKTSSQLVLAASKAIDSGRADWEKMLTAVSAALIEDFGNEIAEDLGGVPKSNGAHEYKWTFDPMSAASSTWIKENGAKSIKTILDTNLDDVRRVILAGVDENIGTVQIAKNVRQFYTDRSPYKAMRVARTETSHAAGFGQREAASQSGVAKTHTWITSRDDRVRDEHISMDDETVAFDKPYSDGSTYPGEQDINCRCVESFGAKEMAPKILDWRTERVSGTITRPATRPDVSKMTAKANTWFDKLPPHKQGELKLWGGTDYAKIRKYQLTGKIPAGDPSIAARSKAITDLIGSAPTYKGTTYRGMRGLSARNMDKLAKADTITFKTLTSTSLDRGTAMSFAGSWDDIPTSVYLQIRSRTGKYIGVGPGRLLKLEAESVAMSNTKYKVVGRSMKTVQATPPFGGDPVPVRVLHLILEEI